MSKLSAFFLVASIGLTGYLGVSPAEAQAEEPSDEMVVIADAGGPRQTVAGKEVNFDLSNSSIPPETILEDVLWDFGDGTRVVGQKASHAYPRSGTFRLTLRITTDQGIAEDTTEVRVFKHVLLLITDNSVPAEQIELSREQAAEQDILLHGLRPTTPGPEVVVEDELTQQLIKAIDDVTRTNLIITWTSGTVGPNVLSKFQQQTRQPNGAPSAPLADKGIILLSETPLGVLAPTAQSIFDQLQPAYVLITRPAALELFFTALEADEARNRIISSASAIEYRLLGTFSARTLRDIGPTNFMSFVVNFLVNRGLPINSIVLILMLPLIATILAFARHVIGIKAFGLVTPTLTTLSFLVMGLNFGLIVFATVLLSGTLTRIILRRWRFLYLPRMALVLTSVSLAMLFLLSVGLATNTIRPLSFSLFPALILVLLAEEFIALQFRSGAKTALTVTAWTLLLSILGYFIVSWEILRTLLVSYPEIIFLTIPLNILLGQWSGLRLTEYFRFRQLLRHGRFTE